MLVPCCAGISVTSAGSISLEFDTRPGHAMLAVVTVIYKRGSGLYGKKALDILLHNV